MLCHQSWQPSAKSQKITHYNHKTDNLVLNHPISCWPLLSGRYPYPPAPTPLLAPPSSNMPRFELHRDEGLQANPPPPPPPTPTWGVPARQPVSLAEVTFLLSAEGIKAMCSQVCSSGPVGLGAGRRGTTLVPCGKGYGPKGGLPPGTRYRSGVGGQWRGPNPLLGPPLGITPACMGRVAVCAMAWGHARCWCVEGLVAEALEVREATEASWAIAHSPLMCRCVGWPVGWLVGGWCGTGMGNRVSTTKNRSKNIEWAGEPT